MSQIEALAGGASAADLMGLPQRLAECIRRGRCTPAIARATLTCAWELHETTRGVELVEQWALLAYSAGGAVDSVMIELEAARLLAFVHSRKGDDQAALQVLDDALERPESSAFRCQLQTARGMVLENLGRPEASEAAYRDALAEGTPDQLAMAHVGYGDGLQFRGRLDEAEEHYLAAEEYGRKADDPLALARALDGRALLARLRGEPESVIDLTTQAIALLEDLKRSRLVSQALSLRGDAQRALGRHSDARASYRAALAGLDEHDTLDRLVQHLNLALTDIEVGRYARARSSISDVDDGLMQSHGMYLLVVHLVCGEGLGQVQGFDSTYLQLVGRLAESQVVDPDIARPCERGAQLALAAAGRAEGERRSLALGRCARFLAIAHQQWSALDDPESCERVASLLVGLSEKQAPIPVDAFELLKPLGSGAMGDVYLARHQGGRVALKVVRPDQRASLDTQNRILVDEVRAVASLDHPGVVHVLDYGRIDTVASLMSGGRLAVGSTYFAMELAPEGAVADLALPWAWPRVRDLAMACLDALGHAHARGVVHLDVKAANILMSEGQPRLADFGLAGASVRIAASRVVMGTPSTMAPEQFSGIKATFGPWTDLYGLGCVIAELLMGRPLAVYQDFRGYRDAHAEGVIQGYRPAVPTPAGLEDWLGRMLSPDIGQRYQCAADAAWGLQQVGREPTVPSSTRLGDVQPIGDLETLVMGAPPTEERIAPNFRSADHPPFPGHWAREGVENSLWAGRGLVGLRRVPFVGRREERDVLWRALGEVIHTGQSRVVVITGALGIGKRTLARWIAERGYEVGAIEAIRAEYGDVGHPGVDAAVEQWLGCRGLPAERALTQARWALSARGVDAQGIERLVGRRPTGGSMVEAAAHVLRNISAARPVVVHLEEADHAVEPWELAMALADVPSPILTLVTVRDGSASRHPVVAQWIHDVRAHARVHHIELRRLGEDDTVELISRSLALAPKLMRKLAVRCAGHPGFACDLIAELIDLDLLVPSRAGLMLRKGAKVGLPRSLRESGLRRVERLVEGLGPWARDALVVAALLGTDVEETLWRRACKIARCTPPEELVRRLERERLWLPTEAGWTFAAPGFRDALVEPLTSRLRELHGACADVVPEALYERRAGHLVAALRLEAALAPLASAVELAIEHGELGRAKHLVEQRSHVLLRRLVPSGSDPQQRILEARLALGLGRSEEVAPILDGVFLPDALELEGGQLRIVAALELGEFSQARDWLERTAMADPPVWWTQHRATVCLALGECGRARSLIAPLAEASEPEALLLLGRLHRARGDDIEAERVLRAAGREATRAGRYDVRMWADVERGDLLRTDGAFDEASWIYDAALEMLPTGAIRARLAIEIRRVYLDISKAAWGPVWAALEGLLAVCPERAAVRSTLVAALAPVRVTQPTLAWNDWMAEVRRTPQELRSPDRAWLMERALGRAVEHRLADRASFLAEQAIMHWRAFGREDRVRACRALARRAAR